MRYNPHVIFVEPKEKQRGIRYFQQLLSIPDDDIVVFGDGMNDICMFGQGMVIDCDGQCPRRAQGEGGLHHDRRR